MLPSVTTTKNVFTTGQAPASTTGIIAIIACSSTGTVEQPAAFARSDLAINAFGYGPLTEYAAYIINTANKPVVLVRGVGSVLGGYQGLDVSGVTGTSVVTTSANPFDTYDVKVTVTNGGTITAAGITLQWTVDGGQNISGIFQLGTATSYAIPNTGVTFEFAAGTLVTGDTWTVRTTRPMMNNGNMQDALNALKLSKLPYELILIDDLPDTGSVAVVDTILSGMEGNGIFKGAILNSRFKTAPLPTAESEAAYAAVMGTTFNNQASIRLCVGADGAHVPSSITAYNIKRPTSMLLAARAAIIPIGEDPAYVARGPLPGAQISNSLGNPFDHDEDLYPDLDDLRLVSLRSFAPAGPQGVYITNANTIQPSGGAFPYLQHIRIMNRACEIAWFILTTQLSRGVRKNPTKDPVTGAVYIFEPDAALIESLVNDALIPALKGQVNAAQFSLSRTDNLAAVPAIVTGLIDIVDLAYIKGYQVQAQYSKTLQAAV